MNRLFIALVAILFLISYQSHAVVTVSWNANSEVFQLYNSSESLFSDTGNLLIQLVIDDSGNTDFSSLVSQGMLGIDTETSFGGVHSTATDDRVGAWATGYWYNPSGNFFAFSPNGVAVHSPSSSEIPASSYANKPFYFRWFNALTEGAATEVGFIWDTSWTTPLLPTDPAVAVDISYVGVSASPTGGGTEFSGAWQSVAPVPEPGTMALFALGLVTLAASRRRRSVKA